VRCSDCHDVHSTQLKAAGNALCAQCHNPAPPARFTGLKAKNYDSPEHHFHPQDSPGGQCVNCHMPAKNYMVVDPRRDHSLRIPRPDLSVKLGTPNACNSCHSDQDARWAAAQIADWYGPERRQEKHYGETLAAARTGETGAQQALQQLAAAVAQPAIVRASALELLYPQDQDSLKTLINAARDSDGLIRTMAVRALERLPPQYLGEVLTPLLDDPLRAVRLEAAQALATAPRSGFNEQQRQAFEQTLDEYRAVQLATGDVMPGAHLNLAVVEADLGHAEEAERQYRRALEMDPAFLPARVNLANLYNAQQRNDEAEQELRTALQYAPQEGELHYSLGLLLAEGNRLQEATGELAEASRLLPQRARVQYNYALALQHGGQTDKAGEVLRAAHGLDRNDPDILQALIVFHMQNQQWDQAYPYAERMAQLYPNAPEVQRTLEQIRALQQFGKKPEN
jgi:predicted CXXCH cytochrome family protein